MYQTNHSMHWFMYMNVIACVRKNIHCIYNLSAIATFWAFRKTWKRENVLRRRAWQPPPPPFHKPWYLYNILHAYVEIWTKLHSFQWFKRNYTKEEAFNAVYPILKLMGNQWEFLQFMLKNREINLRIKIVWRKLSL